MKILQKPFLPPNEPLPSHFKNPGGTRHYINDLKLGVDRTNREDLLTGLREVFRDECARARLGLGQGFNFSLFKNSFRIFFIFL